MNTIIYKSTDLGSLTDIDEKASLVKGYGSVFGNKDSDGDIIMRGAYRKTLQENGDRVKYLYQHDMDKPLGKRKGPYLTYSGTNTEMQIHWQLDEKTTCQVVWGTNTTYSVGKASTVEYGDDHQHTLSLQRDA